MYDREPSWMQRAFGEAGEAIAIDLAFLLSSIVGAGIAAVLLALAGRIAAVLFALAGRIVAGTWP